MDNLNEINIYYYGQLGRNKYTGCPKKKYTIFVHLFLGFYNITFAEIFWGLSDGM